MKFLSLISILIFLHCSIAAQSVDTIMTGKLPGENSSGQFSLTGRFLDADSVPVKSASVQVNLDGIVLSLQRLDTTGSFRLSLAKPGIYSVLVTAIGFESRLIDSLAFDGNHPIDLGTQFINKRSEQLAGVSVRGRKQLTKQTPYGTTVDVGNSVLTKGSSIADLLERSPGVMIDKRTNSITLNGKAGVLIMLDGRLMRLPGDQVLTLLNGMSANDIDKIELLTSPPVSYDADGAGGVINIVSKKNLRKGLNGSINLTAGQGWGPKSMVSGNIASTGKKIEINGSYSWALDKTRTDLYIESAQFMPVFGGDMQVTVFDTSKARQISHNLSAGMIYKPDTITQLGLNITSNFSNRELKVSDRSDYLLLPDSLLYFNGKISNRNNWKDWSGSFFYEKKLKKGKLVLNADHAQYLNENPSTINTTMKDVNGKQAGSNDTLFSPGQRGFANTSINVSVLKFDFQHTIRKGLDLEAGLKATMTNSGSRSGIESFVNDEWVNRDETITQVRMQETIAAGYFSLNRKFSLNTELRVGARFESAETTMKHAITGEKLIERKLDKLFPSVAFTKRVSRNGEIQISYSERITRPTYNDLASFVRYSDATAVTTGNPALKPTLTKNIRLGYSVGRYAFSIQLGRDKNAIAQYQLTKSTNNNLLYVSPQNLRYRSYYNIQINAPFTIAKWWQLNTNVVTGINSFVADYTELPVQKSNFVASLNISNVITLPAGYSAELSGWFYSPSYNGTVKVSAMGAVNAGVKKEFTKNRGRLQLSVTDVFRTLKIDSEYGTLTNEAFNIRNKVSFRAESRLVPVFKLTYSRSFGGLAKAARVREGDERVRKD